MVARTGTLQVSSDRIGAMVGRLEADQLPRYREMDGYKGFTVLADRSSGKVIGISFWDSEQTMEASEQMGEEARAQAAQEGQATAEPIRESWEVVLDDMA